MSAFTNARESPNKDEPPVLPAPKTMVATPAKLVRASTTCDFEIFSFKNLGATKSTIAVEMLPIIVALATDVVVIAVKPKIVETPNKMPGTKTDLNNLSLIFAPLRRTIRYNNGGQKRTR